ncbi:MAG: lipid-A-disaccharide synthase [Bacteroidales bacterium]|jgi:lipid-A-disaccharide synthase|nr:lipid-A-disaccharide synthase [Bacteroidales bacterium]MBO7529938.1 lipid-A-disaccharide synthase [Bacteroidales bacterium]MBQ3843959.1 lipid-A-disaccharide synthase [Bacteroidales bacterium]
MKYYIIAGEASGDLHGSNLVASIRQKDPGAKIRAWGGEKMRRNGANVVKNYHDLAFMGFVEVLMNLKTILKNFNICKKDITEFNPDALILIDYPGFNLKIAKWAKKKGYKVFYYISPQVWAWKRRRVYTIKKVVDKMLCILPFEKKFYDNYDVDCQFVGHPLLDEIAKIETVDKDKFYKANRLNPKKEIIALLPGSRKQEVSRMLTIMLEVVKMFPNYQFVIACAPSLPVSYYKQIIGEKSNVRLVLNRTYQLLQLSSAAIVTSGTATLETALLDVPEVVCYKANKISYLIARQLAKVKYICLVNLIMDRLVVKELIQNDLTANNIRDELQSLLNSSKRQKKLLDDYEELKYVLGNAGASDRAAETIISYVKKN